VAFPKHVPRHLAPLLEEMQRRAVWSGSGVGSVTVSQAELRKATGSSVRQTKYQLDQLEELGWIVVTRPGDSVKRPTQYIVRR
jgi:hypothetical protein